MRIITKKQQQMLEDVSYTAGYTKANQEVTRLWEKELNRIKATMEQTIESLNELMKINTGKGIKTKKQKEINEYLKELLRKII